MMEKGLLLPFMASMITITLDPSFPQHPSSGSSGSPANRQAVATFRLSLHLSLLHLSSRQRGKRLRTMILCCLTSTVIKVALSPNNL
jgi:hypothetical protein